MAAENIAVVSLAVVPLLLSTAAATIAATGGVAATVVAAAAAGPAMSTSVVESGTDLSLGVIRPVFGEGAGGGKEEPAGD